MANHEHTEEGPSARKPETGIDHLKDGDVEHEHSTKHEQRQEHDRLSDEAHQREHHRELHIFVNRRKFGRSDGVKEHMNGAEIAALVGVPPESAVIRIDGGPEKREIGIHDVVHIKDGEHFLVTRKVVEGGYAA